MYIQHLLSMTLIVGVRPRIANMDQRPQGGLIPTYKKSASAGLPHVAPWASPGGSWILPGTGQETEEGVFCLIFS